MKKKLVLISLISMCFGYANAQIEVANGKFKDFHATGFGGFFNFSVPVSDANYVTFELGLYDFSKDDDEVAVAPLLAGYRYTLNHTGSGFYVEPNAGYAFGATNIQVYDAAGNAMFDGANWVQEEVKGAAAGITLGYLFQPLGRIQFNLGLRYEHTFGNTPGNMFSIRLSHAFTFGRRQED